jgi:type I restriction enzyme R subunit
VATLRRDVTTDWVSRDDVRAKIRSPIKRLLAKYGYPPDARQDATELVLRQMETFADECLPRRARSTWKKFWPNATLGSTTLPACALCG